MFTALIMMAGSGRRMNSDINKVLMPIKNKPIFIYSVETFVKLGLKVILVINKNDYTEILKYIDEDITIVFGGETRQESVYKGLCQVKTEYVLIHDAARPFISEDVIKDAMANLKTDCAILVASKVKDTIKLKRDNSLETLSRDDLVSAMTPQGGPTALFMTAHEKALKDGVTVTDDISLIEKYEKIKIKIIAGNEDNFKITTAQDYQIANLLRRENTMYRIGHAWDTHKLVLGRRLLLGGVEIDSELGLLGHSDADVVLHAVAESLLGSLSLGDLGTFFPCTDEYKDIDSKIIAYECYQKIIALGFKINNLDLTIYSENIKIAPYRIAIKKSIANILKIDENQVSVKATTYEKMGFIGRGEALACECVCLVFSD